MASATILSRGDVIDYTPVSAVAAGDVVTQGVMVAVAPVAIAANTLGSLQVRGLATFPRNAISPDITAGCKLYWNATSGQATTNATGTVALGYAVAANAASANTIAVVFCPGP